MSLNKALQRRNRDLFCNAKITKNACWNVHVPRYPTRGLNSTGIGGAPVECQSAGAYISGEH